MRRARRKGATHAACALLGLVLLTGVGPASAQAGAACVPGGTVEQVNACALRDFQAADTDIGVLYSDVMRALSAHERPQLRREHTAWMQQRNAGCKQATRAFELQADGPRRLHECMSEKTRERRAGLMRWLSMDSPAKE
ncbi:MAG: DUF1311 domain-containing protein [Comamonadaceae bacterium]|nr:MAG: DUF1311 domain-containing protein [Comamonadaceae bacterium]